MSVEPLVTPFLCFYMQVFEVPVEAPTFTVAWHPTKNILAYACDDKDRHNRDHDAGTLKLFGLPSE